MNGTVPFVTHDSLTENVYFHLSLVYFKVQLADLLKHELEQPFSI